MFGLMEGIRQGGQDARSDAELALQRQRFALQQAQDARAAEAHAQGMQEGSLRLGGLRRVDQATQALVDMNTQGAQSAAANRVADDDFDAANRASAQGMPLPAYNPAIYAAANKPAPTDKDFTKAMMGLAAAKGDLASIAAARHEQKKQDVADELKANMEKFSKDPEFRQTVYSYINREGAMLITARQPPLDKNGKATGPVTLNIVSPDGDPTKTKELRVGAGQEQQIMLGVAYMKHGMADEGLKIIAGVNADLAKTIHNANEITVKAENSNTLAGQRFDTAEYNKAHLAAQVKHWADMAAKAGAGQREISPENARKLADLEEKYVRAAPKDKAAAWDELQVAMRKISLTDLRKPMGLPTHGSDRSEIPPDKLLDMALKYQGTTAGSKLSLEGAMDAVRASVSGTNSGDARFAAAADKLLAEKKALAEKRAGASTPTPEQTELQAARAALAKFGSVQRNRDPAGYEQAVRRLDVAQQRLVPAGISDVEYDTRIGAGLPFRPTP